MANLTLPNTITNGTTADATEVQGNDEALRDYVNDRNDGTTPWNIVNVTATNAEPVKIVSDQATTIVSIDNTATDGDPVLQFKLGGTAQFSLGVDDGDGDVLKLGTTAIGTSTMFEADSSGAILKALQPSFLVTAPTNTANTTGDGTTHTVEFDTEIYDQNADFNTSTYTFTAPVTGRYLLSATVQPSGQSAGAGHTSANIIIATSNRNYNYVRNQIADGSDMFHVTVIADMDASDTVSVTTVVSGGTKVVEVSDSATENYFSGSLIN